MCGPSVNPPAVLAHEIWIQPVLLMAVDPVVIFGKVHANPKVQQPRGACTTFGEASRDRRCAEHNELLKCVFVFYRHGTFYRDGLHVISDGLTGRRPHRLG